MSDATRKSIREVLGRLIAFDTTSRNSNLPLIDYVEGLLKPLPCRIERISGEHAGKANLWITEYVIMYEGKRAYTVSIMEFRDEKVSHETQYFADPVGRAGATRLDRCNGRDRTNRSTRSTRRNGVARCDRRDRCHRRDRC